MLLLRGIRRRFSVNGVQALDGADFELRGGEIHALLGENGAGKSTLMHIAAGYLRADEGTITVDGAEKRFASPARALDAGIGMVRQHPRLAGAFTVWENCILGAETSGAADHSNSLLLSKRRARAEIAALNERWGFRLPLEKPASALTVSEGQKTAVLALLRRNAKYLIFDEPAAVLSPDETETLFALFKKLRDEGKGVVIISHKLNETLRLAGRLTILRHGKTAAVINAAETEEGRLSELIFGGTVPGAARNNRTGRGNTGMDASALELEELKVTVPGRPLIRGITLKLPQGRITGIAGVRDSGLETLELAVAGYLPITGKLSVNGHTLSGLCSGYGGNVRAFREAGGAYLGAREKSAAALPLRDILVIHAHRRFQKHGILNVRALAAWSRRILLDAGLPAGDGVFPTAFSGGQFQRILLLRELEEKTPLLVLSDPFRGLDGKNREEIAAMLRERANEGSGILIFSSDSEELVSLCDMVMTLRNGALSGAVDLSGLNAAAALSRVRKAMIGGR
jgi:simple sugar transport system ATP-binding protein